MSIMRNKSFIIVLNKGFRDSNVHAELTVSNRYGKFRINNLDIKECCLSHLGAKSGKSCYYER